MIPVLVPLPDFVEAAVSVARDESINEIERMVEKALQLRYEARSAAEDYQCEVENLDGADPEDVARFTYYMGESRVRYEAAAKEFNKAVEEIMSASKAHTISQAVSEAFKPFNDFLEAMKRA